MRKSPFVYLYIVLAAVILIISGCSDNADGKERAANQSEVKYYDFGEEEGKDALRILLDVRNVSGSSESNAAYELSQQLEKHFGLSDITFEYIPKSGSEREMIVDHLKIELMSGEGPDVFIVRPSGVRWVEDTEGNHNPLFPYPEKVMETGLFLPLDNYMENNSKLTDWSKQQQTVLAAGKNAEGQQIIPLTYSFPILCYQQSSIQVDKPNELLAWNDIIEDPELATLYKGLIDINTAHRVGLNLYLDFVVGKTADFGEEKLLFTEEELLLRIKEINSLRSSEDTSEDSVEGEYFAALIGSPEMNRDYPLTMLPLYSDDGGITVSIDSFAVVNRNTRRPEDAYAVIDVLMSEYMQQKSQLYSGSLHFYAGIPMYEDLYQESKPLGWEYMIDENYAELVDIREQITAANFHDDLAIDLQELLARCQTPELFGQSIEEIVHEAYEQMQRKVRE